MNVYTYQYKRKLTFREGVVDYCDIKGVYNGEFFGVITPCNVCDVALELDSDHCIIGLDIEVSNS